MRTGFAKHNGSHDKYVFFPFRRRHKHPSRGCRLHPSVWPYSPLFSSWRICDIENGRLRYPSTRRKWRPESTCAATGSGRIGTVPSCNLVSKYCASYSKVRYIRQPIEKSQLSAEQDWVKLPP